MAGHNLEALMTWMRREEWAGLMEGAINDHVGETLAQFELELDDLWSVLDDDRMACLWACIFEEAMTRYRQEDDVNPVDDYLKRRGLRETATTRTYMKALRDAVMSLYEVSDIKPGEGFLARDLVRGGEPVWISENRGSRQLKPWDRLATRIVKVGPRMVMAGGTLTFDLPMSQDALSSLEATAKAAPAFLAELAGRLDLDLGEKPLPAALGIADVVDVSAPVFTAAWLGRTLDVLVNKRLPEVRNSDGDEILFTVVRYPLAAGAGVRKVRAALDALPALRPEPDDFWNWVEHRTGAAPRSDTDLTSVDSQMDDGATVLGNIELKGRVVELQVNSAARAQRARAMIEPALEGLVKAPSVKAQTLAELMASPGPGGAPFPAASFEGGRAGGHRRIPRPALPHRPHRARPHARRIDPDRCGQDGGGTRPADPLAEVPGEQHRAAGAGRPHVL